MPVFDTDELKKYFATQNIIHPDALHKVTHIIDVYADLLKIDLDGLDTAMLNYFANYAWDNKALETNMKAFAALRHKLGFPYCKCKGCRAH